MVIAEGGGAAIARSILETMKNAGVVTRFKLEPFKMTRATHGVDATPDILFQTLTGGTFVVEVKSARFLTAEKIKKCQEVEAALAGSGMSYLLWTDRSPTPPALWRLVREMRRLGFSAVPSESIKNVIDTIREQPRSVAELRQLGIYRDAILCSAWHGAAHFNLHTEFCDKTMVSKDVSERQFSRHLKCSIKNHVWWDNMPKSQTNLQTQKQTQSMNIKGISYA